MGMIAKLNNLFDGLGTELIVLIVSVGLGLTGLTAHKLVSKKRYKQKAGDNSVQIQSGRDTVINDR